jgi:hypothetical protein
VCKELYDRLVETVKSKKLVLIAVANKQLKQAFSDTIKIEYYLGSAEKLKRPDTVLKKCVKIFL